MRPSDDPRGFHMCVNCERLEAFAFRRCSRCDGRDIQLVWFVPVEGVRLARAAAKQIEVDLERVQERLAKHEMFCHELEAVVLELREDEETRLASAALSDLLDRHPITRNPSA